jgi:hypothetical protein
MTTELVPRKTLVPQVVDQDGKPVTGPALESVTQLVTQMASLANLARIRKAVERQSEVMEEVSAGHMRPFPLTIEGSDIWLWQVKDDDVVGKICYTASIVNDGPDSCYAALNDLREGFHEIKSGESMDFDFKKPRIERFFFKSTDGGTAALRVVLEY